MSLRWVGGSNKSELSSGAEVGYVPWNQMEGSADLLRKHVKLTALVV